MIPSFGGLGRQAVDVSMLGGTLLVSMAAVAFANKTAEQNLGVMQSSRLWNFAGKAVIASVGYAIARNFVKDSKLRGVVLAGLFAPLIVDTVEQFMPQVAAQIPVLGSSPMLPAPAPKPSGTSMGTMNGAKPLAAMLRARLDAQLEDDSSYIYGY